MKKQTKFNISHYEYNDHGVCTNPDIILDFKGKGCWYTLSIANSSKGWLMGYDLRNTAHSIHGKASGVSIENGIHPNAEMAKLSAVEEALDFFSAWRSNELNTLNELHRQLQPSITINNNQMAKGKRGSKNNPLNAGDVDNQNLRSFIINEASIKDDICNYTYEVTSGIGIGDKHGVIGTGIVDDSMHEAFGKFNVHMAAIDEVFKHAGREVDDIDTLHADELALLYRVRSFKIKKSKGFESVVLKGEKYVSSAGGWMQLTTPEIALDSLSSYKWYNELKESADNAREEVSLYKEGRYTPVKADEPKADANQLSLVDAIKEVEMESEDELLNAQVQ